MTELSTSFESARPSCLKITIMILMISSVRQEIRDLNRIKVPARSLHDSSIVRGGAPR